MAKKKEKKLEEKDFIPSNAQIECTGCSGQLSSLISTTPTVFVKKQPMATVKDVLPTSIVPFPMCTLNTNKTCLLVPEGKWKTQDVLEKIAISGQTPLVEGNTLKCTAQLGIGIITISEITSTPAPPENIIDKAQNKINKATNYVTKKVTEVAQAASDAIGGIADAAKSATGFLQNDTVQEAVANASDFVDNVDRKKAELDVTVANLDIRLNNLRKELTQLLTGQEQELGDLMALRDATLPEGDTTTPEEPATENMTEEKELRYHQEYFNEVNRKTANTFLSDIESDIETRRESASRLDVADTYTIEENDGSGDTTRLFTEAPNPTELTDTAQTNTNTTPSIPQVPLSTDEILQDVISNQNPQGLTNATTRYNETNEILESHGVSLGDPADKDKTIQSLVLLEDLTNYLEGSPETGSLSNLTTDVTNQIDLNDPSIISEIPTNHIPSSINERINEERIELDASVQAEIDSVLEEIGYLETLQEYKEESNELQEDLDNAAAALNILGDFNAFIDGIAAEKLGKLAAKYTEVMDQIGKNMSRLNTSMKGLSFAAGGFTAGDVITHAPDQEKEREEEKEEEKKPPPPILPPPTTSSGGGMGSGGEEQPEEETDECTFTKITIIKNNTLEYIVVNKEDDQFIGKNGKVLNNFDEKHPNLILDYVAPSVTDFIVGTHSTKKTTKKLIIKIENLHRKPEHKKDILEYDFDGKKKTINYPDGNTILDFDINYNSRYFEEQKLLGNFMGLIFNTEGNVIHDSFGTMRYSSYNIPLNLSCTGFNPSINLRVFPDAEWSLIFSVAIKTQIASSFFTYGSKKLYKDELEKHDYVFGLSKVALNSKDFEAEIKFAYGVTYNEGKDSLKLEAAQVTKAVNVCKKIYEIADKINEITDKIVVNPANRKKGKAYSVTIIPPTLNLIWKNKLKVADRTIFDKADKLTSISFSADPLIATEIFINLVKTSRRMPLILVLATLFEVITGKEIEKILTFTVSLNFKVAGEFSADDEGGKSVKIEVSPVVKFVLALYDKGTALGIEYEAGISLEVTPAGSLSISSTFSYENDKWYNQSEVMFNGVEFTLIITAKASGTVSFLFFDELTIGTSFEEKYSERFFAWEHPIKTEKTPLFE